MTSTHLEPRDDALSPAAPPSPRPKRTFAIGMAVTAALAAIIRVVWVLAARRDFPLKGDDFFYHWQANALADGKGFLNPYTWKGFGRLEPSAAHPPLYSLYLAVWSWLGFDTPLAHRLASCVLGVAAVVVVGLVGRRIAGDRAGILAAGVAAVYPELWINDGMLVSESMYVLVIAATLLFAYRLWDSRSWLDAGVLGALIGLSALTRPEAVILVPLIGLPFLFSKRDRFPRRVGTCFVIGALCLLTILPWWVRNITQFRDPTFLATGNGVVLQVSNCDQTYSGEFLGYWNVECLTANAPPPSAKVERQLAESDVPGLVGLQANDKLDDSEFDTAARDKGFTYIDDHLKRFPVVVAARVGRIWGVFRAQQTIEWDIFFERRGHFPSWSGAVMYYALVLAAVYALVAMWRRRVPISPMIAIFAMVTITVAASMGITRYRVGADVALAVLGGVAIEYLIRHFRRTSPGSLTADAGHPSA